MNDLLGKVVCGLESCTRGNGICQGVHCPYHKDRDETIFCRMDLVSDICSLLQIDANAPRVMTLEEITKAEVVWTEYSRFLFENTVRIELPRHPLKKEDKTWDFQTSTYEVTEFLDEYGKTWRCWTSRPTDEQREATPWE